MASLFAGIRMLDCPETPEFNVHGARRIELMPDGNVIIWNCEDYAGETGTKSIFCVPRVKIIVPIQNLLWNTQAISQWAIDLGLMTMPMKGPARLIAPHGTKH